MASKLPPKSSGARVSSNRGPNKSSAPKKMVDGREAAKTAGDARAQENASTPAEIKDDFKAFDETVNKTDGQKQEGQTNEVNTQEPKVQEPKVQEPKLQEPEIQEPKVQEQKVQKEKEAEVALLEKKGLNEDGNPLAKGDSKSEVALSSTYTGNKIKDQDQMSLSNVFQNLDSKSNLANRANIVAQQNGASSPKYIAQSGRYSYTRRPAGETSQQYQNPINYTNQLNFGRLPYGFPSNFNNQGQYQGGFPGQWGSGSNFGGGNVGFNTNRYGTLFNGKVRITNRRTLSNSRLIRPDLYGDTGGGSGQQAKPAIDVNAGGVSGRLNPPTPTQEINVEMSAVESRVESQLARHNNSLAKKFRSDEIFRQKFTEGVVKLAENIDYRTKSSTSVTPSKNQLKSSTSGISDEEKINVATSFMSAVHNREDLVNQIADSGMTVIMTNDISTDNPNTEIAGFYSTENVLVLNRNSSFSNLHETAVHELTHKIDHLDGAMDGERADLGSQWASVRDNAVDKIIDADYQLPGLDEGFLDYALTNNQEFYAVMSQLYHTDRNDLQKNLPGVFNALDGMFRA